MPKKDEIYQCINCHKRFKFYTQVLDHWNRMHKEKEEWKTK